MAAGSTADEQIFVIYVITIEDSQISHAYIQKLEWGYVKPLHWVYAVCTITQEHHEYHAFRGMFHTVQTIAEAVGDSILTQSEKIQQFYRGEAWVWEMVCCAIIFFTVHGVTILA